MLEKLFDRLSCNAKLMRLHRPIGILLLLWPTLWALWIAGQGRPDKKIVFIFVMGVVIMRSAGCIINDYADRHFDGHVARTRERPLVTGTVTSKEALILFSLLCLSAFLLVLTLNRLTLLLSFIGLMLASLYPFMKRYIDWPQAILGMAFAWGIPMAFAAQNRSLGLSGWLLFTIGILWPIIYDTQYAMVDRADDLKIGLRSTAILFGKNDRLVIASMQTLMLMLLILLGSLQDFYVTYYLSLTVVTALFAYQQYLIKDRDPKQCFKAFLNNQWVGLAVFLGISY